MTNQCIVRVPVATIWTSPTSPRSIDQKAVSFPMDMNGWLAGMSTSDRKELTENNLVQTQVLFGGVVTVIEEQDEWLHVSIPDQPSSKLEAGYPGWLPKEQVVSLEDMDLLKTKKVAIVTSPLTELTLENASLEISFQTTLPVTAEKADTVEVKTALGIGELKRVDVKIRQTSSSTGELGDGEVLVKTAEKFLSLPYLWGGMSGFGYDCSGLTSTMHKAHGITLPRDAFDQAESGRFVDRDDLEVGDCIYFSKEEGSGRITHVGMYYGNGKMIHAPSAGKGIEIIPLATSKYDKKYATARRYWKN